MRPKPFPTGSCVGSLTLMGRSQVKGIPFLVFDAGGVLEMFDPREFSDNVVFEPTLAALKHKLSSVVSAFLGSSVVPLLVRISGVH